MKNSTLTITEATPTYYIGFYILKSKKENNDTLLVRARENHATLMRFKGIWKDMGSREINKKDLIKDKKNIMARTNQTYNKKFKQVVIDIL